MPYQQWESNVADKKKRKTKRERQLEFFEMMGIPDPYWIEFEIRKKQLKGFIKSHAARAKRDAENKDQS